MLAEDEARRKAGKPLLPVADVPGLVRDLYGKEVDPSSVSALDSYDDLNFRVSVPSDGLFYTVKVHNGSETEAALEMQTAVLQLLASKGFGVPEPLPGVGEGQAVPRQLCAVRGNAAGQRLAVRLMRWVPGRPLAQHSAPDPLPLKAAGAYLARLRLALDEFDHPGAHRYHPWDLRHTPDARRFFPYVCGGPPADVGLLEAVVAAFESDVLPCAQAGQLPSAVLHGDFNDGNIVVADDAPDAVAGVIDFGDTVHSWRVNEIAIAAAYACVSVYGQARPPATTGCALQAFLEGFGLAAPNYLTQKELDVLRVLCCSRLTLSIAIGAYSHHQDPANEYLLMHARPAWTALAFLWHHDPHAFREMARSALRCPGER